jgi:hypothetical protein
MEIDGEEEDGKGDNKEEGTVADEGKRLSTPRLKMRGLVFTGGGLKVVIVRPGLGGCICGMGVLVCH